MFKKIKITAQKELKIYFNTPIAYISIALFLIINGWFFSQSLFINNIATISSFLNIGPFILMFFIPAITMRLISEEKKNGFIEIMLTLPITDGEYILGKYLAVAYITVLAILFTLIFPITTAFLGKLDPGQIIGAYIGLILLGLMYAAISLFASSITSNQVVAFLISFVIIFALYVMGKIAAILSPNLLGFVEYISTDTHLQNISRGVLDSRDFVYYFSFIFAFLYFAYQTIGMRKYK